MALQRCPMLIPETCDYVTAQAKGLLHVIELRSWRWEDYLGLSSGSHAITRVLVRGRQEAQDKRRYDNKAEVGGNNVF